MEKENRKIKTTTIVYSILTILLLIIVAIGLAIYVWGANNNLINLAVKIIPYPATVIEKNQIISINQLAKNVSSVKSFYENQDFSQTGFRVDFSTPEGQKRLKVKERDVLNKLIENKIIERLARERGIEVTSAMVSQSVNQKIEQYGNQEEVKANIKKLYNWDLKDFENNIVKPDLYREALAQYVRDNEVSNVEAKKSAEEAKKELTNRVGFADVVKKYSKGESAKSEGELGWFTAKQMLPEIAQAAFSLKAGARSEVIASSLGYHIIEVEEKRNENGVDKVRLRQIFLPTKSFSDWLLGEEKNITVWIPGRNFYWDQENGRVEFRDSQMKEFEENLIKNSNGDISMLFN